MSGANYFNVPLLSVVLLAAALAIAASASPSWMRWAAARLMARAESLEAQRRISRERQRYWLAYFDVDQPTPEEFDAGDRRRQNSDVTA